MEEENNSFLWGILGFFVPIVGLILFILWNNTKKKSAKAAGIGALIRVIITVIFVVFFFIFFTFAIITGERIDGECDIFDEECTMDRFESTEYNTKEIKLYVNEKEYIVSLEDNSSAIGLLKKLKTGDIHVKATDYGNFEKVGSLDFDLPSNDKNIITEAGDLILYQNNKICLYYDTNTYSLTKIGHINNINPDEFRSILGEGDVEYTLSIMYK